MAYQWPADTDFSLWELDVQDRNCPACGRMMHICDHRYRRLHTLDGPVQLICKLNHCPDRACPGHAKTKSPELEITIALPQVAIGWDVFCWIGHRRCSRHMAVSLIRSELLDDYAIALSDDAIEKYIRRYQAMLAARQQDAEALRRHYRAAAEIILCIDGLQPEKGHETLYVVRELSRKRESHPQSDLMLHTGMLKGFMDGSLGSHTAALLEPYTDDPKNSGLPRYDAAKLNEMTKERVLAEIRQHAQAEHDLAAHRMQALDSKLVAAAVQYFGSWKQAIEEAGFDYEMICLNRHWTRFPAASSIPTAISELLDAGGNASVRGSSTESSASLRRDLCYGTGLRAFLVRSRIGQRRRRGGGARRAQGRFEDRPSRTRSSA